MLWIWVDFIFEGEGGKEGRREILFVFLDQGTYFLTY